MLNLKLLEDTATDEASAERAEKELNRIIALHEKAMKQAEVQLKKYLLKHARSQYGEYYTGTHNSLAVLIVTHKQAVEYLNKLKEELSKE